MTKKILFPQVKGMLHGGDYNPDQWLDRPDILEKDIELMKKAHINVVTLGVFSWAAYEKEEGQYDFSWLVKIIDDLYANGIYTIMATPSGARPAWMDAKYPEVRRYNAQGEREMHRERHNHCMTSPIYREKVVAMDTRLAQAVKGHPGVILWHISNELGGDCYCPLCASKFRTFLKQKYHDDIEELNHQWWTGFWSKHFNSFEEIEPPYEKGENAILALKLDWRRFSTFNACDFMKTEIAAVRAVTPDIPVNTNMMEFYPDYDYRVFAKELDVISWDSYPMFHNDFESLFETMQEAGFTHATMRSLKKQPYMLMESTPGQVNWRPINRTKKPGMHKLASAMAIANGADTVQYFQIRQGRGAVEQWHSAVISHSGRDDTRIFKDVTEVGEMLQKLEPVSGTMPEVKVGLMMDWDTRWSLWFTQNFNVADKKYEKTVIDLFTELRRLGVETDIIGQQDDYSAYKVILAPMMFLLEPGTADKLKRFVADGGTVLMTYISGYVNQNMLAWLGGFPGDGLMELFGLENEEIDILWPSQRNAIKTDFGAVEAFDYCEKLHTTTARTLATYQQDWYQGTPAITVNDYGQGKAYYVGCRTRAAELEPLFKQILDEAGVAYRDLPKDVEYHARTDGENTYEFYLNESENTCVIHDVYGNDLLSGPVEGDLTIPPYGVAVVNTK